MVDEFLGFLEARRRELFASALEGSSSGTARAGARLEAQGEFWLEVGRPEEALATSHRLLELCAGSPGALLASHALRLAVSIETGDAKRARVYAEKVRAALDPRIDPGIRARALLVAMAWARESGDAPAAESIARDLADLAAGDLAPALRGRIELGVARDLPAERLQGLFEEGVAARDPRLAHEAAVRWSRALLAMGRHAEARRAVALARQVDEGSASGLPDEIRAGRRARREAARRARLEAAGSGGPGALQAHLAILVEELALSEGPERTVRSVVAGALELTRARIGGWVAEDSAGAVWKPPSRAGRDAEGHEVPDSVIDELASQGDSGVRKIPLVARGRTLGALVLQGVARLHEELEATEGLEAARVLARTAAEILAGRSQAAPPPDRDTRDPRRDSRDDEIVFGLVSKLLREGRDIGESLARCLSTTAEAVGADRGFVFLLEEGKAIRFRATFGIDERELDRERLPVSFGCVSQAVSTRRSVFVRQVDADDWARSQASLVDMGVHSLACVPILGGGARGAGGAGGAGAGAAAGQVLGILYVDARESGRAFEARDLRLLERIANEVAPILEGQARYSRQSDLLVQLETVVAQGLADLQRRYRFERLVGRSAPMQEVYCLLERVISVDYPVLIEGETGSGKELVARSIHFSGRRKGRPFFPVNCGAVSESLLESELFGHRKGAFTGASSDRKGYFELAEGGTLFLDEVEEMSAAMQTKLLRVLQEKTIRPVGSDVEVPVDVRLLVATNRPLSEMVERGEFRQDLYYRANVVRIRVPPLRERIEDLPLLVDFFLEEIARELGGPKRMMEPAALQALARYSWPGNVRELANELKRMCVVGGAVLTDRDVGVAIREAEVASPRIDWKGSLDKTIEEVERGLIVRALRDNGGHLRKSARALGLAHTTLLRRIERLGIDRSRLDEAGT